MKFIACSIVLIMVLAQIHPGATAAPASNDFPILTPSSADIPRINGAKVFGVHPGNPFLFKIPATGKRPITFSVKDLPDGLTVDTSTGIITGSIKDPEKKTHAVIFCAENSLGKDEREFRIVVGDTLCLTPPMGWNSWYCFSEGISQEHVKQVADAFVKTGLVEHGWTYVNIDDCWQGVRDPESKALQGNERFTDMKGMCDYVHAQGLKVGIYHSPWMGTYAGFRGGSCMNADGTYDKKLSESDRLQPNQVFGRYPGTHTLKTDRVGPNWFCDADAKQWAEWGFDYVKHDWNPNDIPTTERILKGLEASGRDIVLSLSNAAPIENAEGLSKLANLWRTGGDIHDNWGSICRGFEQEAWNPYSSPGHWNDTDMLQVGMVGQPNRNNAEPRKTHLTANEQYTHFSMWCLLANPLLLSCYIDLMDDFTLGLLTNDEVIAVDQDPLGIPAEPVIQEKRYQVWARPLEDGSMAVGLFNLGRKTEAYTVTWKQLGIDGKHRVRDLWRQKDLGTFKKKFEADIESHGVVLVQIFPKKK